MKQICTDEIGSVEGNVSLCASNVSVPKGCIEYEENKVSFSLAGKDEPSGRERILCKGNKKIDYIFPVDCIIHVSPFLNMLVIFDVHVKVCVGNKGICATVHNCCFDDYFDGRRFLSNGNEVKCVDVYYHKQKIVKRECREFGRVDIDEAPTTTTAKPTAKSTVDLDQIDEKQKRSERATPTVVDGNNNPRGSGTDEF